MRNTILAALGLLMVACSRAPDPAKRADALAAFAKDVEPQVTSLLAGTLFDPPAPPTWTAAAKFGLQDSANPMDPNSPYDKGDRVLREGTLPGGATFWAEGFYSYKLSKMQSVTVVIDFPETSVKTSKGNTPITPALLSSLHIHPALADALMQGLGKGSMSGSGPLDFQARAEVAGKQFEVSTAITRGKPLLLELSCTYFL